ncbi:hypothetical protein OIU77_018195 [Salix suchowensis]|uniref:Uncharacterized protein n=1 Tax=Salix suchowensis TaxID=1278906 RepID=A0ABQ8ZRM0_9ROSI|nr:hypothetical protein OIU77_018195 [Salix suchowensis]
MEDGEMQNVMKLTSVHFGGMTSFLIAWLANFKLLLFAFGKGPLCLDPEISFRSFYLCCLFSHQNHTDPTSKTVPKRP